MRRIEIGVDDNISSPLRHRRLTRRSRLHLGGLTPALLSRWIPSLSCCCYLSAASLNVGIIPSPSPLPPTGTSLALFFATATAMATATSTATKASGVGADAEESSPPSLLQCGVRRVAYRAAVDLQGRRGGLPHVHRTAGTPTLASEAPITDDDDDWDDGEIRDALRLPECDRAAAATSAGADGVGGAAPSPRRSPSPSRRGGPRGRGRGAAGSEVESPSGSGLEDGGGGGHVLDGVIFVASTCWDAKECRTGNSEDDNYRDGSPSRPFLTIPEALNHAREVLPPGTADRPRRIVLRGGTHHLRSTVRLGPGDSHTTFESYPGERAWISGGAPLVDLEWRPVEPESTTAQHRQQQSPTTFKCFVPISDALPAGSSIVSLFSPSNGRKRHRRYVLARHPNVVDGVERDMWGFDSPRRDEVSLNIDGVLEWEAPPPPHGDIPPPHAVHVDLRRPSNPTGRIKNDSAMVEYNAFTTGWGGTCASVWDADGVDPKQMSPDNPSPSPTSTSYWCSPHSAGGWAFVDADCARSGRVQIPIGLRWNTSDPNLAPLRSWSWPPETAAAAGAGARKSTSSMPPPTRTPPVLHAWHSQSWAVHMFDVKSIDADLGRMEFDRNAGGRGSQGGRNWCRCDQCTYAGKLWSNISGTEGGGGGNWCGRGMAKNDTDRRLIGGSWFVEGVPEALDHPNEFYFDPDARELYLVLNSTDGARLPPTSLVAPVLETLISIEGDGPEASAAVHGVAFRNVGFRDALMTYRERWGVPSGGDWALHKSAALRVENSTDVEVGGCVFRRLDGNAVLLTGYNRRALIERSLFEFIGQNAAGAWGDTSPGREWDGTGGLQPRGTTVWQCRFRDVGLFQKQSSAWFQAKAAQTTLEENVIFNVPRAAVNFNDGFGGGNVVRRNVVFNTCRESGDHGPINTWDRMPFLTDVRSGDGRDPSFDPAMNVISNNLIFANYGASQAVDNDDGSSFYEIRHNVFIESDGFKMDYGGHNSSFHDNFVVSKERCGKEGPNCIGTAPFLKGIADAFYNNTFFVLSSTSNEVVGSVVSCEEGYLVDHDNTYATHDGKASLRCGDAVIPVSRLAAETAIGLGDRATRLPGEEDTVRFVSERVREYVFGDATGNANTKAKAVS